MSPYLNPLPAIPQMPSKELPIAPQSLSREETISFREEIRTIDIEMQGFFRVYYLTGLIVTTAWVLGPESKPVMEIAIGNGGNNVYAALTIAALNAVVMTMLLYKSIEIQEIAQFLVSCSEPSYGATLWEAWRRSNLSHTRWPRLLSFSLTFFVPAAVSFALLLVMWDFLSKSSDELAEVIRGLPQLTPPTAGDSLLDRSVSTTNGVDLYAERVGSVVARARIWFIIVVAGHIVPIAMLIFHGINHASWKKIWSCRLTGEHGRDSVRNTRFFSEAEVADGQ